jgi:hypothetical protein
MTGVDVETSGYNAGGIVGDNHGTIENCSISGRVVASELVGGIAGDNYGTIENCQVSGNVEGNDNVGGIAGENCFINDDYPGIVRNCTSNARVIGGAGAAGGIAGLNWGAVLNCYASGKVTSDPIIMNIENKDIYVDVRGGVIGYHGDAEGCAVVGNTFSRSGTGQEWGIGVDERSLYVPSNDGATPR